nr:protein nuclear fusion defective 5, mitochondrial [Tanacetum cinerariifolium]
MTLKHLLSKLNINKLSRLSTVANYATRCVSTTLRKPENCRNVGHPIASSGFSRFIHSGQESAFSGAKGVGSVNVDLDDDDLVMDEFFSRFVWIMRGKLTDVYVDADKEEINAMLRIIVGKVLSEMEEGRLGDLMAAASASEEFSEDLWRTVWEVSNVVLEDMKKAKKKEKMKKFLQSDNVKEMARFAGEIWIRGDLLRECRFKWAREELEDSEFYESLERMRRESKEPEVKTQDFESNVEGEDDDQVVALPKRSGNIKYNIYGLDLSKPKWAEVAENINESEGSVWPQEPKAISGKCKIVTEKMLSLKVDDDPTPLITEWIDLLQPTRVDWIALLGRMKEKNGRLYFKIAELLLDEVSFQSNIRDYSKLVDAHAELNQLNDAERIIRKTNEKGIEPDILTKTIMVHMYSKSGNLTLAKEAFESLRSQGFQPDVKVYNSMIMAYVNAGDHKSSDSLMRDLESKSLKPSKDLYLSLLRSYAQNADPLGAGRMSNRMELAGYHPSLESCTYLVEAYSRKGNPDQARSHFDEIIKLGYKPDDQCIARMIAAYAHKNLLDKALHLLLQLEKDGIEHSVATYSVLVDWLGKLQLIHEVEDLLGKFAEKGVSPSLDVHISLCDMYARAKEEKKALQALGVLEANKDKLKPEEFEKVISALMAGGFRKDAERLNQLMTAQGFKTSDQLKMTLRAAEIFSSKKPLSMK